MKLLNLWMKHEMNLEEKNSVHWQRTQVKTNLSVLFPLSSFHLRNIVLQSQLIPFLTTNGNAVASRFPRWNIYILLVIKVTKWNVLSRLHISWIMIDAYHITLLGLSNTQWKQWRLDPNLSKPTRYPFFVFLVKTHSIPQIEFRGKRVYF